MSQNFPPVLYLFFNRPQVVRQTFPAIAAQKPAQLFLVCDGPRPGKEGEEEKVRACRDLVESLIDWPCEVHRNYAETNMGCGERVASGISWFFEHVESGVILEDDCLPHADFFLFCAEMLERYRDDTRIMHVGGTKFPGKFTDSEAGWTLIRTPIIWGWATWRRAWKLYDKSMTAWRNEVVRKMIQSQCHTKVEGYKLDYAFDEAANERIDTWDYQWHFALRNQGGLAIVPSTNLVQNLGFDEEATHTTQDAGISFQTHPWVHGKPPSSFLPDQSYMREVFYRYLGGRQVPRYHSWRERVKATVRLWTESDFPVLP